MSKYRITLDGKVYEMEIERVDGQAEEVRKAPVPAQETRPAPAPETRPAPSADAGQSPAVRSPMPGTVLRMNLAKGDRVKKGQPVLVLEAMKMENEIVAHGDGVLCEVYVSAGDTVQGGAPLFEIGKEEAVVK